MTADLLTRVSSEIDARLAQLRPALAEYEQLLGAYAALEADSARCCRRGHRHRGCCDHQLRLLPRPPLLRRARRRPLDARGLRGSAAGAIKRAASAPRNAAQQAIVAALEHGSHTVGELVLVTAIPGSEIRDGVRRLQRAGTVRRTKRDGRAAYALPSSASD